jgi:hypothetical protein
MYRLEPPVPTSRSPFGSVASSRAPGTFAIVLDENPLAKAIAPPVGEAVAAGEAVAPGEAVAAGAAVAWGPALDPPPPPQAHTRASVASPAAIR